MDPKAQNSSCVASLASSTLHSSPLTKHTKNIQKHWEKKKTDSHPPHPFDVLPHLSFTGDRRSARHIHAGVPPPNPCRRPRRDRAPVVSGTSFARSSCCLGPKDRSLLGRTSTSQKLSPSSKGESGSRHGGRAVWSTASGRGTRDIERCDVEWSPLRV